MAKIDESIFVFIIAIAFLGILFIVANFLVTIEPFGPIGGPGGQTELISSFDVGLVGPITDEPAVSTDLGNFIVGETQSVELKSVPSMLVHRGYLSENREEFEVE